LAAWRIVTKQLRMASASARPASCRCAALPHLSSAHARRKPCP